YVLCVASTPVPPTATTTGASVAHTVAGIPLFGSNTGTAQFWDGINLSCSTSNPLQLAGTNNSEFSINNATIATTNAGINLGAQNGGSALTASTLRLNNVTFSFSSTSQGLFLV